MKVHYDKDEDILMLVLSDQKVDDSYETDFGTVEISKDKEPIILEFSPASKFLKDINKVLPKNLRQEVWSEPKAASVPHRIK